VNRRVVEKSGEVVVHVGHDHVHEWLLALVGWGPRRGQQGTIIAARPGLIVMQDEGHVLCRVGCSTAMSSSLRTLWCDKSLSSLISRRAVMGNYRQRSVQSGLEEECQKTSDIPRPFRGA
jgi:hypothetical protein